eukprot:190089_1
MVKMMVVYCIVFCLACLKIQETTAFKSKTEAQAWLDEWLPLYDNFWKGRGSFDNVWKDRMVKNPRGNTDQRYLSLKDARDVSNKLRRMTDTGKFQGIECIIDDNKNTFGPSENALILDCKCILYLKKPIVSEVNIEMTKSMVFNSNGLIEEIVNEAKDGVIGQIISEQIKEELCVQNENVTPINILPFELGSFTSIAFGISIIIIFIILSLVARKVNKIYDYLIINTNDTEHTYKKVMEMEPLNDK